MFGNCVPARFILAGGRSFESDDKSWTKRSRCRTCAALSWLCLASLFFFSAQVTDGAPAVKKMPALPSGIDPIAAKELQGLKGDELREGLEQYNRAVMERQPKAMPTSPTVKADGVTGRNKKSVPVVDLEKSSAEKTTEVLQEEPDKVAPEAAATAALPRAAPPVKPEGPAPRPRRPFPPPRGFRWGMNLLYEPDFFPSFHAQGIRAHERPTASSAAVCGKWSVAASVLSSSLCGSFAGCFCCQEAALHHDL